MRVHRRRIVLGCCRAKVSDEEEEGPWPCFVFDDFTVVCVSVDGGGGDILGLVGGFY